MLLKLIFKCINLQHCLFRCSLECHEQQAFPAKFYYYTKCSVLAEAQLKENQAKLIMEKHERSDIEIKFKELLAKQSNLVEENESLSSQVSVSQFLMS